MSKHQGDDVVVRVRDLSVSYGSETVLDRANIDVHRGERLGIYGASGTGKSTLVLALLNAVDGSARVSGEITVYPRDGDPVAVRGLDGKRLRKFRRETIAVAGEGALGAFEPTSTIRKSFRETLRARGADVDDGMDRARELSSAFGLDPGALFESIPGDLDGGSEELALVIRALLADPEVLVLDDVSVAFGRLSRQPHLRSLQGEFGFTAVVLGRELPAVAALSSRLAVLHDGHFVEDGPPDEVRGNPSHPYTRELVDRHDELRLE